jgi:hypothetical protein
MQLMSTAGGKISRTRRKEQRCWVSGDGFANDTGATNSLPLRLLDDLHPAEALDFG